MKQFTQTLLHQMENQLQTISLQHHDAIVVAEQSIIAMLKIITSLKKFILRYKFSDQAEEILFFKHIKPQFMAQLIYHNRILHIHTQKPQGSRKKIYKYWLHELAKLNRYFHNNHEFYKYHRTGSNFLDHKYFVRGHYDVKLNLDTYYFEADSRFCTSHDYKVAKIMAHHSIKMHIEGQMALLNQEAANAGSNSNAGNNNNTDNAGINQSAFIWTGSKVSLIELMYAIHASGAINNGQVELHLFAAYFQKTFGIDLGQFHRTFIEIRERKTGRTKFLDMLKTTLINRMDSADELL